MPADLYLQTRWLPQPPPDWRRQLKCIKQAARGADFQALASYALSTNQLEHLGRTLTAWRALDQDLAPLLPFRLGIVSNSNLDFLMPQLVAAAARHGIALECIAGEFGQTSQQALDPGSRINLARCDAVLVALDHRAFFPSWREEDAQAALSKAHGHLASLTQGFQTHGGAISIVQTLAPPPESLFGNLDGRVAGTLRALTAAFNSQLLLNMQDGPHHVVDVAAMAETVGLAEWHAPAEWLMAKQAVSLRALPYFADQFGRLIGAICGKARRCLVLDLDNTLWGGIVGDDGPDGLKIGMGHPLGEAFTEVQSMALALRARGIVLAISSKNDDSIARSVFRHHPDMVLREEHIAIFQANWSDKASNIEAIAQSLSLGLSSIVFLDDNPVERALVRQRLPEVAVPELPADPSLYPRTLAAAGYFEATAFVAEDSARGGYYAQNAQRAELAAGAANLDDFLASLEMEISFRSFDDVGRDRIVQLIAKSNQFNLTTKRYGAREISRLSKDPDTQTIQARLRDRFGDNGMISIVILCMQQDGSWLIDSWLMSCRVLGRGVEQMMLDEILRLARRKGITLLRGVYRPSSRNGLVSDHYEKLGFRADGVDEDQSTYWVRNTDPLDHLPPVAVIERC